MKRNFAVLLLFLAVVLYLVGLWVLAAEVQFSFQGLWHTVSNGALFGSFLAQALGALAPGIVFHYLGRRALKKVAKPT